MGRPKQGSASLPTPLVLVLCLACFLGGHFLVPRLVDSPVRCSARIVSVRIRRWTCVTCWSY